jgi:hypothetical protein
VPGGQGFHAALVAAALAAQRQKPVELCLGGMREQHQYALGRSPVLERHACLDPPVCRIDDEPGVCTGRGSCGIARRVDVDRQAFLAEVVTHDVVARAQCEKKCEECRDDDRQGQADDEPHEWHAVPGVPIRVVALHAHGPRKRAARDALSRGKSGEVASMVMS